MLTVVKAVPSKQLSKTSSSVTKNTFPPSSVDQFLQLIFYSNKRTNLHRWLWFPPHFRLIVGCLSCNGNDGTIKGEYFVRFFGWNMQNLLNLPCVWPQIIFPASYLQWRWRERETGVGRVKNDPAFPPGASELGDLCTSWIRVKIGVLFGIVAGRSEGQSTLPW